MCLWFGNVGSGCVRVMLGGFTQEPAEFLGRVWMVSEEAFLLCPEIVLCVVPGGKAGTGGLFLRGAVKIFS